MSLVVDASMAIAWLFIDEQTEVSLAILHRVGVEAAMVPAIWRLEVANALRTAIRRRRCTEDYATECLERLGRALIVIDGQTDRYAWQDTWRLSRQHRLTPYDAAYLELALRLRGTIASRDSALLRAARDAGLEAIGD